MNCFMKQKGAMLAKGRVLGLQFLALFENGLYFSLAKHANEMALFIRKACLDAGWEPLNDSPTNQQFFLLPNEALKKLEYAFSHFGAADKNRTIVRICTSWATRQEDAEQLAADIKRAGGK